MGLNTRYYNISRVPFVWCNICSSRNKCYGGNKFSSQMRSQICEMRWKTIFKMLSEEKEWYSKNEWNNASDISQWWRTINIINGQHKGPMLPNHGFGFTPKLSFVKWVTFLESIAWKQELDILPIVWLVMPIDAMSDTGHICYTYYHFWNIS